MEHYQSVPFRKELNEIKTYSPGKPLWEVQKLVGEGQKVVKLASNENPLGPSPKAVRAIKDELAQIHRYPDANAVHLRELIAAKNDLTMNQIIVTNGADELITLISEAYLEPGDEIIVPVPSFGEYDFGAHLMGARVIGVPLMKSFAFDLAGILNAVTVKTKLIYICSPNNPTGTYMARESLQYLLDNLPTSILVVFDGAYSHYATAEDYTNGLEYVHAGYHYRLADVFENLWISRNPDWIRNCIRGFN